MLTRTSQYKDDLLNSETGEKRSPRQKDICEKDIFVRFFTGLVFSISSAAILTAEASASPKMPFVGSTTVTQSAHGDGYGLRAIDLGLPAGTPVIAPDDVVVVSTCNAGNNHRAIKLRSNTALYALIHVTTPNVSVGKTYRQGELIGTVASDTPWNDCAQSKGVHLHFAVSTNAPVVDGVNLLTVPYRTLIRSSNIRQDGLLDPRVFNAQQYLSFYSDLQKAFGSQNYQAATTHWLTYGIREGRKGSLVLDPRFYLNNYQDLQKAFGANNYEAAINHWLTYGIREGRASSPVFDVRFYLGAYQDLQKAFGANNYEAAIVHWLVYGIPEGRKSSPVFDIRFYLGTYQDLQKAFGATNYEAAIIHWLTYGSREGRRALP